MTKKKMPRKFGSRERSRSERLIKRVVDALDAERVDYVVIGGQAVNYYGHSRFTGDVDFTIDVYPDQIDLARRVVEASGIHHRFDDAERFLRQTQVLPCLDPKEKMGVDFSFVSSPYMKQAIGRGVWFDVAGRPVRFLAIEDLLLQKVIANRPQDRIDVVELLVRHGDADMAYIRRWLAEFADVLDEPLAQRFDELKREADA